MNLVNRLLPFSELSVYLGFTPENFELIWRASELGFDYRDVAYYCCPVEDSYFLISTSVGILIGYNGRAKYPGLFKFEKFLYKDNIFDDVFFQLLSDNGGSLFFDPSENRFHMTVYEIEILAEYSRD
jgi:hypothetical protein